MTQLDGRTVIITGGARGQGAAEVRRFAAANARVLIADVQAEEGAALAAELGERVRYVRLDVTREDDWQAGLAAISDWDPVQVLVNNAAIHWARDLLDETAAGMTDMLAVNVIGPLLGIKAVVPAMTAAGRGSIINVCSVLATLGGRDSSAYTASKWALRGLTKSAAIELGPRGIRVNAIHPGYVETPMLAQVAQARPANYYDYLPLGRSARPDEIAELVLYLAADSSGYVTGGDFVIDGGMTAVGGPRGNRAVPYGNPADRPHDD